MHSIEIQLFHLMVHQSRIQKRAGTMSDVEASRKRVQDLERELERAHTRLECEEQIQKFRSLLEDLDEECPESLNQEDQDQEFGDDTGSDDISDDLSSKRNHTQSDASNRRLKKARVTGAAGAGVDQPMSSGYTNGMRLSITYADDNRTLLLAVTL